jgi:hypothetical protein
MSLTKYLQKDIILMSMSQEVRILAKQYIYGSQNRGISPFHSQGVGCIIGIG